MRVICSTINGNDVEGEVIDGKCFDVRKESYDLNEMFTLRRDNGEVLEVHGWLVDVTVLNPVRTYKM